MAKYAFVLVGSVVSSNPNLFPRNQSNYYNNMFNPNTNSQYLQNPNLQQKQQLPPSQPMQPPNFGQWDVNGGIGIVVRT